MNPSIDLYDTPIDLRPVPKLAPEELITATIDGCIAYLRQHGDHYGAELLNGRQENSSKSESTPA